MLEIQKKYVKYNYSKRSSKPEYIVVHDTGNPGAGANNHYLYFNGGNRSSSADIFVDSNNIIQIINTDVNYSWAVGDGKGAYGITNANSCSVEMCLEKDGNPSEATISHTLDVVKYLMSYYGIGINNVVRHYDTSRKNCPNSFKANSWAKWNDFKARLAGKENVVVESKPSVETPVVKTDIQKRAEYVGSRCRELQEKLNKLGYNCGTADGIYGKNTDSALLKFQSENGLVVDGYAGTATFAKLDQLISNKNTSTGDDWIRRLQTECNNQGFSNQKVDGYPGANTLAGCPTLRLNSSGNITRLLQEKLVKLGYNTNGVDGKFGNGTLSAVKAYQKAKGLTADGVVGKGTWSKLLGL